MVVMKNHNSEFTKCRNKETVLPPALLLDFQAVFHYLSLVHMHNNTSTLQDELLLYSCKYGVLVAMLTYLFSGV
jgi:hypothetical protein